MAIIDGQDVNASVTNAAFVSRTDDTNTVGVLALENTTDPDSGASVDNTQQAINETFDAVGMTGIDDATRKNYSSNNVVANGDSHKTAIGKVDAKFHATTGHAHTGVTGDAPQISAADLLNINLFFACWQTFSKSGVTGGSTDVTAQMSGKTPGGNSTTAGVITSAPDNKIALFDATTKDSYEDAEGQKVYGRLTYSASVWTLAYYTNEVGVETNYNFSGTVSLQAHYLEVFDQAQRPTIPNGPEFGSLDVTADVVDAGAGVRGLVGVSGQTWDGYKTFSSGAEMTGRFSLGETVDNTTIGANATVGAFVYPLHVLTNASLTSVAGLTNDGFRKMCIVINKTGADITLKNESASASAVNRIRISSGLDITWKNYQAFYFIYETTDSRWYLSGGDFGDPFALTSFGSTPNANGASYNTGTGDFNLEPADATHPGGVSIVTQTVAGAKHLSSGSKTSVVDEYGVLIDSTTTGASAEVTASQPIIQLTDVGLISVGGILPLTTVFPSGSASASIVLTNKTGVAININDEDAGVTAAKRILTGTSSNLTLEIDASISLYYDVAGSRWRIIGGSGSGNGSTGKMLGLKYRISTAPTITANQVLVFDTLYFDTDSAYDNTTGVFTAQADLIANVDVMLTCLAGVGTAGNIIVTAVSNGAVTELKQTVGGQNEVDGTSSITFSGAVNMLAGDTLEIYASSTTSAPLPSQNGINILSITAWIPTNETPVSLRYDNVAGTAITFPTLTVVPFATADFDYSGGQYNSATGEFTAGEDMILNVSFSLFTQTNYIGAWFGYIIKTGGAVNGMDAMASPGGAVIANTTKALAASGLVELAAGEKVWIASSLDTAGTIFLAGGTSLSIHRIG